MFKKQNPKQNFYELEQEILKSWKEQNILDKSIENRSEENNFTFYDGPITANGEPHTGHMLTFSLKDVIPRYKTMKGFKVARSLGWDCHGIPVEYQVEKKLGFTEKSDIEKYGIEKFNKKCKASVEKYRGNIIELEEKIGRLTNSDEEYATMDSEFIESVWWSLKKLYDDGKLYEGFKVVPYSTRAGTTLSNAEVALGGYKKIVDPAITVKFPLAEDENTSILAWTTTPWTMPSNLGLAVGKDIIYVKVKVGEENYIVAKDLVDKVFEGKEFEMLEELKGSDLVGKKYLPPFDYFKEKDNAHQIYEGFHVTTESGTGIVHLAPYGAEDNEIFQEVGIESFDVLDDQGDFTDEIPEYAGMNYRSEANPKIIEDLQSKNRLFKKEDYEHDMPMCWRTDTPLIYKPITSWFVAMSQYRDQLVENNNKINWIPNHVKDGRFGNWLKEIKDWGISRNRYWGTPLPVWKSESGKVKFIGSFEELEKLSGVKLEDPHRPYVDEVTFEIDGEKYTRINDVIDVWYDSGAMPFARLHSPFENEEKFKAKFPAEYIAEGIDQTRGWFYSLHAIATTLFGSNAYKNVIINGTITDDKGQKLSKSKGNYTAPDKMIEAHGADAIRINFFNSPLMYGEDTAITDKTLKGTKQEFIMPLWNILSYFITYANIHNWSPREELAYNKRKVTTDSHPWDHIPFDEVDNETDAWILVKLQETIKQVEENMDSYLIAKSIEPIGNLISEISKWYIRSNRQRFIDGDERALEVLYYVLLETTKLLAPFAPFISEYIYKELVVNELDNQLESIHLCDYPETDPDFVVAYQALLNEMQLVRKIAELGHTLRVENSVKVRQALNNIEVKLDNKDISALSDWMLEILKNELNVKEVTEKANVDESNNLKVAEDSKLGVKVGLNIEISEDLKKEGTVRELTRFIQANRKKANLKFEDRINLTYSTNNDYLSSIMKDFAKEISENVGAKTIEQVGEIESKDYSAQIENGEITVEFEVVE